MRAGTHHQRLAPRGRTMTTRIMKGRRRKGSRRRRQSPFACFLAAASTYLCVHKCIAHAIGVCRHSPSTCTRILDACNFGESLAVWYGCPCILCNCLPRTFDRLSSGAASGVGVSLCCCIRTCSVPLCMCTLPCLPGSTSTASGSGFAALLLACCTVTGMLHRHWHAAL